MARPNVTLDVAALAIKTGNVAILRGRETIRTNLVLVRSFDRPWRRQGFQSMRFNLLMTLIEQK
jgi:glutamate-5-semialdehyde dehydrogenase